MEVRSVTEHAVVEGQECYIYSEVCSNVLCKELLHLLTSKQRKTFVGEAHVCKHLG